MKLNEKWIDRISRLTDLEEEAASILPLVEIAGNRRVLIEHHKGVIEYDREKICVQVREGLVRVLGRDLILSRMTDQQLSIKGCIHRVELERS